MLLNYFLLPFLILALVEASTCMHEIFPVVPIASAEGRLHSLPAELFATSCCLPRRWEDIQLQDIGCANFWQAAWVDFWPIVDKAQT